MKRHLVLCAALWAPDPAAAGVLTCNFTEPFLTLVFDTASGVVTQTSSDDEDPDIGKPVPRTIATGAHMVRADDWQGYPTLYVEAAGRRILEIRTSGQGSDGMSEFVYPFDGTYGALVGGCETTKAPAYDLYEVMQDLGVDY